MNSLGANGAHNIHYAVSAIRSHRFDMLLYSLSDYTFSRMFWTDIKSGNVLAKSPNARFYGFKKIYEIYNGVIFLYLHSTYSISKLNV